MNRALVVVEIKKQGTVVPVELFADLNLTGIPNFPNLTPTICLYREEGEDSDNLIMFDVWDLVRREIFTNPEIQENNDMFKKFATSVLRDDIHVAVGALDPALPIISQKLQLLVEQEGGPWRAYLRYGGSQTMVEGKFDAGFDFSILTTV